MAEKEVKKIGAKSLAITLGAVYLTVGLMFSLLQLVLFAAFAFNSGIPWNEISWANDYSSLLFLPLELGMAGVVLGALIAAVYNFSAKKLGGIKIELE